MNTFNVDDFIINVRNNLNNIISSFSSRFYDNCVQYMKNLDKINEFNRTHIIIDKHLMEPIRLYFYKEFNDYYFYLVDTEIDSKIVNTIREYSLLRFLNINNEKTRYNILKQLDVIENNDLNRLFSNLPNAYTLIKKFLLVISHQDISDHIKIVSYIKITSKKSLNLLLNEYVLKFLNHQDIDRFINYFNNSDTYVRKSVNMFKNVYNLFNQLDDEDDPTYNRLLLFSGFVLHTLGTTYTSDADLIYDAKGLSKDTIDRTTKLLDNYQDIEYFIYVDSDQNVEYISDLLTDPDKHYHFLNMRIINIKNHLKRLYQRASPSAFVDLIMLDRINNIKIKPCIPVITVDENKVTVYTKESIDAKLKTTQKYFKIWHGINYSIDDLKELISKCKNYPNDRPFRRRLEFDKTTIMIDVYIHIKILAVMNEYLPSKNSNLLLLDDGKEYPRYYPTKNSNSTIMILEPFNSRRSTEFIDMMREKIKKMSRPMIYDIHIVDYNKNWIEQDIKFNTIMIKFCMSDLMNDRQNMTNNLNNISSDDCTLLLFFIDGDVINILLNDSERFEIMDDDDKTIIGIYRYDDVFNLDGSKEKQFVIYIRDTLRHGTGTIEKFIYYDDVVSLFDKTGFRAVKTGLFSTDIHEIEKIDHNVLKTLGMFRYVLFKKMLVTNIDVAI